MSGDVLVNRDVLVEAPQSGGWHRGTSYAEESLLGYKRLRSCILCW